MLKKSSLLLSFGPAEIEVFKKLDKYNSFPDNKSELFRRSLRAAGYLADMDELSLRSDLIITLTYASNSPDAMISVTKAKNQLTFLLAVSAIKNGPNKDQFLENLLRQLETYREKLAKYINGKGKNTGLDPKDPFIQMTKDSLSTIGETMKKIYYNDDKFFVAASNAMYPK